MDSVVQRLVDGLGVGYLKLDYNIHVGGSDSATGGPGHGLLEHQRAFLTWLDDVLDRYPNLVVENCASGGMRCDHAMLSRLALQSTSDQRDPLLTAPIAVAAPAAVAPEQAAVWAYPQHGMDDELFSFCLINALLGRIHLSGRIDRMDEGERQRVRDALACYRSYRNLIPAAQPDWPLGLPGWYDDVIALGLLAGNVMLLAVWFRGQRQQPVARVPLFERWAGADVHVVYPADLDTNVSWEARDRLAVSVPAAPAARLLRLLPADRPRPSSTSNFPHLTVRSTP
jgi:alpha-galactosidase